MIADATSWECFHGGSRFLPTEGEDAYAVPTGMVTTLVTTLEDQAATPETAAVCVLWTAESQGNTEPGL